MIVRLVHKKKLVYPGSKRLPQITLDDEALFPENSLVLTFRDLSSECVAMRSRQQHRIKNVSALTRIAQLVPISTADDVTLHGIDLDSPLAPILVWDVAHAMKVGAMLRITGVAHGRRQIERQYYDGAFERVESATGGVFEYRKVAMLAAERSDLDAWTFGIPVGPDDATLLNACVKRILELDVPEKEIILCGRPGANFKYWDLVRIVGEDIKAPPVQIALKKNRIVQEARHPNLCILHDRVFLPKNFMSAVRRFGNAYPLTTFQSFYFDDRWNLVPRRYSDFNTSPKIAAQTLQGLSAGDGIETSRFSSTTFALAERGGFVYANPHRSSPFDYPTGSLYLCKRDVWLMCPQDSRLAWAEFEDVEHGVRAAEMGIPSRINPHAFTQSMISRPIISWLGAVHAEKQNGVVRRYRPMLEWLPVPRKPMIKKTVDQAISDFLLFAKKYAPDVPESGIAATILNSRSRVMAIALLVRNVQVPIRKAEIRRLLKDYEKLIIGDQMSYQWYEQAEVSIVESGGAAMSLFMDGSQELLNQAALRPGRNVFARTMLDFLPKDGLLNRVGSMLSAIVLGLESGRAFVFDGGVLRRYRLIRDSTPYRSYAT